MRDIELLPTGDDAYASAQPGGLPADTALVDPSFADTKAYTVPSLGGEFGPGRTLLVSGPADGGEADLAAAVTVTPAAPSAPLVIVPWPGLAANNTSFDNLYPWINTPGTGLDFNNPNPPPG